MKTIVRHQTNFNYMKFQPGDGTIYTVLFGRMVDDTDNMYIALGSGDHIRGGYFFRISSVAELAREMIKWIVSDRGPLTQFVREYHYFEYQHSKLNIFTREEGNTWTTAVAVLFALVFALGDVSNSEHLSLISYVYYNNSAEVLEFFYEVGLSVNPLVG